jgi:transportin-3
MEDYVHYLVVMLEFAPDILFASSSFADGFRVALSALTMYHGEIIWPAVEFLTGVLQHDCLNAPLSQHPTLPHFPAYATAIRAVVEAQGFSLIGFLLAGLLNHFDETTSIATTVLFKRLVELWPRQLLAWLTTALEQLSSASVPPASKANLVSEFAA